MPRSRPGAQTRDETHPADAPFSPGPHSPGPNPRARPAPPSADARLLAIASDHLRRLGHRQVTVVGVAAEAGMTHANVYRYFPSKTALVDAVAGRWLREVEAELGAIADAPDPADDKLERLLLALASMQREVLARDPHLFAVHRDATVESRPIARRHRGRLRQLVERVIEEGMNAGTFSLRDRERGIAFIFDTTHRFLHPVSIQLDAEMPRDLIETRLGAVIRAMLRILRIGTL
ncbi:TetR/AcrR family transcriptional regulator [Methylobacterium aquaticum]|uniref:TetR/AcrR family transcriptional regulator n=1 Tax=Methylobacterium aquaticum TaxID=270351 RepID=UPI001932FA2C|nr:TetR/AcrR family transcriptional regulator [Methylobacterium aquaticum]QRE72771.1 TetR/AcrR family transcriptional regulator [Methylobacterium aquaticum]